MKPILIVILWVTTLGWGYAQDAVSDFSNVYKTYEELPNYTLKMHSVQYETEYKKAGIEFNAIMAKRGDWHYSNAEGQTTIVKSDDVLYIDEEEEKIFFYKNLSPTASSDQYKTMLEQINPERLTYVGTTEGIKQYSLSDPTYGMLSMDFFISNEKNTLTKVIYFFDQSLDEEGVIPFKVEVSFELNTATPSSSLFNMDTYISINGTTVTLKQGYREYELIQTDKK